MHADPRDREHIAEDQFPQALTWTLNSPDPKGFLHKCGLAHIPLSGEDMQINEWQNNDWKKNCSSLIGVEIPVTLPAKQLFV